MALPTAGIGAGSSLRMIAGNLPQAQEFELPISIVTGVCNQTSTVTVAAAQVTANSIIVPTLNAVGGTVGAFPVILTTTAGTGFTFKGAASDTSTYAFLIIG